MAEDGTVIIPTATHSSPPPINKPLNMSKVVSDLQALVNVKLDLNNFTIWELQLTNALKAKRMLGYVDGTNMCPASEILNGDGVKITNSEYEKWTIINDHLISFLTSVMTAPLALYVRNLETAHDVWNFITKRFKILPLSHIHNLMDKLHDAEKKTEPMSVYLAYIRDIAYQLALASFPVKEENLIFYTLRGLPGQYPSLKTHIRARDTPITMDVLSGLLLSEEINLEIEARRQRNIELSAAYTSQRSNSSNYNSRGRSGFQPNRGRNQGFNNRGGRNGGRNFNQRYPQQFNNQQYQQQSIGPCQVCGGKRHSTEQCWYKDKQATSSLQAFTASNPPSPPQRWLFDSGCTDHMTNDVSNLSICNSYQGSDQVNVGNSQRLQIQNTGHGQALEEDSVSRAHP